MTTYVSLFNNVGKWTSFIPVGIEEGPSQFLRGQNGPYPALANFATGGTSKFTTDSILIPDDPICAILRRSQLKRGAPGAI